MGMPDVMRGLISECRFTATLALGGTKSKHLPHIPGTNDEVPLASRAQARKAKGLATASPKPGLASTLCQSLLPNPFKNQGELSLHGSIMGGICIACPSLN